MLLDNDKRYMQRAIELARLGLGNVSPNPLVGCVIVHEDRIIGEGWHRKFGEPHAEVHAINSVKDKNLLPECVLYVNLEPCSHYGKTPPCADLLVSTGIKRVVIANQDPNPVVSGNGIEKLRQHGVEVVEGVMKDEGAFLNRRFFTFQLEKRPYIILKWAQTSDGYLARSNYDSKWISNRSSRQLVHKFRSQEDAIMVGRKTAYHDDPALTTREWKGNNPLRIVLDPKLRLDPGLKLFNGSVPTLCYNNLKDEEHSITSWIKIPEENTLKYIWKDLFQRQIQSILVEGGSLLLTSILNEGDWDEARVFYGAKNFGDGIKAPVVPASCNYECSVSGDKLRIYYRM